MKLKKLLCVLVCVMIILSMFAGCSQTEDKETTTTPAATTSGGETQTEAAETEDPFASMDNTLTISWVGITDSKTIADDNTVQKKLEEKFNVKLENNKTNIHEQDQLNLMINAGEMPDCGFMYRDDDEILELIENEVIRSIPNSFIRTYAPLCAQMFDENPLAWALKKVPDEDALYALVGQNANSELFPAVSMYRLDWLENVNMAPDFPDMYQFDEEGRYFFSGGDGYTLDEVEAIFTAFAKGDPDQNGNDDTYGMTGCGAESSATKGLKNTFDTLLGAFGISSEEGNNMLVDGKLLLYQITPQWKEFVKLIADWYQKGLIDPELLTSNINKMREKQTAGYAGWATVSYSYLDPTRESFTTRPPLSIAYADPDAKILLCGPEIGPDGLRGAKAGKEVTSLGNYFFVNSNVDDEKLARILMIYDYVNLDDEGYIFSHFGVEGETFDWYAEPYKSRPVVKEGVVNTDQGFLFYNNPITTPEQSVFNLGPYPAKMAELFLGTPEGLSLCLRPYKYDYFMETDYPSLMSIYQPDLDLIWSDFFYRAMTGEIDVDAEWDAYVADFLESGGQLIQDELEKAPTVEDIRNGKVLR